AARSESSLVRARILVRGTVLRSPADSGRSALRAGFGAARDLHRWSARGWHGYGPPLGGAARPSAGSAGSVSVRAGSLRSSVVGALYVQHDRTDAREPARTPGVYPRAATA